MNKTISLGELLSKYKTKEHFITAYKLQSKVLPDEISFGWNYIGQIITGKKLLINESDLQGFHIPPR